MAIITYPDGVATAVQFRSEFAGGGGGLITTLDWDLIDRLVEEENIAEHRYELRVVTSLDDVALGSLQFARVVRLVFDSGQFREFRVETPTLDRDRRGGKRVSFVAVGPHRDLVYRSGIVRQPYANGELDPNVALLGLTPSQHMSFIVNNSDVPDHFEVGNIDWSLPVDAYYSYATPWAATLAVAEAIRIRVAVPVYTRISFDDFDEKLQIDMVADPASGEDLVDITFAQNQIRIHKSVLTDRMASQVVVRSAGESGEELSNADAAFEIGVKAGSTIDFLADDSPFTEDDFANLLYVEDVDGSIIDITDTVAPKQIVLASTPLAVVGDRLAFKADSAGTDLLVLESPTALASIGPRLKTFQKADIPPIDNIASNSMFTEFSGDTPIGWNYGGAASGSQDTDDQYSRYGLSSWNISLPNVGDYVETDDILIHLDPTRRYLTCQILIWVAFGAARLEWHDRTDTESAEFPKIWWPDVAEVRARSGPTLDWALLGVFPGMDFYAVQNRLSVSRGTYRARIEAEELSTSLWIDAWQIIKDPTPRDMIYPRSASADLFLFGRDYLANFGSEENVTAYDVEFLDRERLKVTTGQKVVVGGNVRLTDTDLDADIDQVTKRMIGVSRNHKVRGETKVDLEDVPAHLAERFMGRPPPAIRAEIPENIQVPPCGQFELTAYMTPDLEVTWARVAGAARYELRYPGSGLSPRARWETGTRLVVTGATSWILKAGSKLDFQGQPVLDTAEIDEIMIDAYNRFGVPGECFETVTVIQLELPFQCDNFAQPDADELYCSGFQAEGDHDVGEYLSIPIPQVGLEGGQKVSICLQGSTLSTVPSACNNMIGLFSSWTVASFQSTSLYFTIDDGVWDCGPPSVGPGIPLVGGWLVLGGYEQSPPGGNRTVHIGISGNQNSVAVISYSDQAVQAGEDLAPALFANEASPANIWGWCGDGNQGWDEGAYYDDIVFCKSYKIRLWGTPGYNCNIYRSANWYWGTEAYSQISGGVFPAEPNNYRDFTMVTGPAPYSRIEIKSGSTVISTYNVARGLWPGDEWEWADGGTFTQTCTTPVGPSAEYCLITDGFVKQYSSPFGGVMPAGLGVQCGGWGVKNDKIWSFGTGRGVLAYLNWASRDFFIQTRIWRLGSDDIRPGACATASVLDIQAAARVEFKSQGIVIDTFTAEGTQTADLDQFQTFSVVLGYTLPFDVDEIEITRMKRGTSPGEVCHQWLQVNVGPNCCTYQTPQKGLPPVDPYCLQNATLVVDSVANCAAGTGVALTVNWLTDPQACDDKQYAMEFWFYEEQEPTGSPNVFNLVYQRRANGFPAVGPVPVSAGTWSLNITDENLYGFGGDPLPGVRGSDGTVTTNIEDAVHAWYAIVVVVHKYVASQRTVFQTASVDSPVAYAECT